MKFLGSIFDYLNDEDFKDEDNGIRLIQRIDGSNLNIGKGMIGLKCKIFLGESFFFQDMDNLCFLESKKK